MLPRKLIEDTPEEGATTTVKYRAKGASNQSNALLNIHEFSSGYDGDYLRKLAEQEKSAKASKKNRGKDLEDSKKKGGKKKNKA